MNKKENFHFDLFSVVCFVGFPPEIICTHLFFLFQTLLLEVCMKRKGDRKMEIISLSITRNTRYMKVYDS